MKHASLRSSLAKVRGLGSAKSGTGHFIWQRATALLMIPLSLWFLCPLVRLTSVGAIPPLLRWFSNSFNAVFLVLLLLAVLYHAKLGMQIIIEDYVHCRTLKIIALFLNNTILIIAMLLAVLSIVSLHFRALSEGGLAPMHHHMTNNGLPPGMMGGFPPGVGQTPPPVIHNLPPGSVR